MLPLSASMGRTHRFAPTATPYNNTGRPHAMRKTMKEEKHLEVGDIAPMFKLKSLDGEEEIDLEKFRGKKPVVLFFGSYS